MKIDTLRAEKISTEWNSIHVDQTVEQLSPNQETSRSNAGWRRIRSETPPTTKINTEEESQEQLQIQLEEAYHFATIALEKIPSLADKTKEKFLASLRELNIIISTENISFLYPFIESIDQEVAELQRDLLLERGFLALALNQKEFAIDDFRKASHCECDDPEFLFRVFEKALGAQIGPFKDYEKEIETLLQESSLYEEERYQLVMYCALLGQHDKALDWYKKIKQVDDFPSAVPFFLAYLRGDMETAKKELRNCPNEDYNLIINHQILQKLK
jgi:tetratricopeptide (TPR) repeat protein